MGDSTGKQHDVPRSEVGGWREVPTILRDSVIVASFLFGLYGVDRLSHLLFPPHGPVFFHGTMFEFPLQWMIDTGHILNFGAFLVHLARRTWSSGAGLWR